ncbi:MAG: response regulator [Pirellulales bacterium]
MTGNPTIRIVDDDPQVRESIALVIESMNLRVEAYASAAEFLAHNDASQPGCLILDLRMPEIGGLELFHRLADAGDCLPAIIITGHGDVPTAVEAIKAGAVNFIEKPYSLDELRGSIRSAVELDVRRREGELQRSELTSRFERLNPQEREVVQLTAAGKTDKQIAVSLGVSPRTVQLRRSSIMKKMHAGSRAELIGMAQLVLGLVPN